MRLAVALEVLIFLALLPLLRIVPYWFPVDPSVASAASAAGYSNAAAYVLVVIWSLALVAAAGRTAAGRAAAGRTAAGLLARTADEPERHDASGVEAPDAPNGPAGWHRVVEVAIVCAGVAAVYFPWSLSRYGPYIEDNAFTTLLYRMHAGQLPYRDFEFLYGPLMIYPAHAWMRWFGYSLTSYYGFLCLQEAVQYGILLLVLQRYLPDFRRRLPAFLLLASFVLNTYLGLNYNGLRRLLPVYVMLLVASRPASTPALLAAAAVLGTLLAYSHEYGAACLLALLAIFALRLRDEPRFAVLLRGVSVVTASLGVWFAVSALLLGGAWPSYVEATRHVIGRMSAGEQGFAFQWTVNSLAAFGLSCLACVIIGRGLARRGAPASCGDYLLLGGLVYALAGLRGGLNRADVFHLTPPMLVLVCAFVLPAPKTFFAYSRRLQHLATALIVIMAATHLLALAPSGSYYAAGLLRGWRDVIGGRREPSAVTAGRAPVIESERANPDPDVLALAAYLADPARSGRPVVFYGRAWSLDKRVGVPGRVYPPDDFLLSEDAGLGIKAFLQSHEEAVVVMDRRAYRHLLGAGHPREYAEYIRIQKATPTKALAAWLSTINFNAVETESELKEQRWERTVGSYVLSRYHPARELGRLVVLERREPDASVRGQ
jgi:hypothetical protein